MNRKKSPFKMLICLVQKDKADIARGILKNAKEQVYLSFLAEGVKLDKNNLLGGDREDMMVLVGLVRSENAARAAQGLDLVLCPDNETSYGVVATVDISSISREMLEYLLNKQKETE